jgi:[protein-PII] uridylyltransferase
MIRPLSIELCDEASELINKGEDGFSLAEQLTKSVDDIVVSSCLSVLRTSGPYAGTELALLAVGGYGRREMMPYSDIDIMLLSRTDSKEVKEAAQAVLYKFWDRGLNISHSFRTLKGCIEDAVRELHTRTSLLDCRFLAGDEALFDEFRRDVYPKLLFKNKRNFTGEMLREIDRRHKASGESLYLLEPNVKEGRGGLRDINSISWLCRSELKVSTVDEYRQFMQKSQFLGFLSAYSFLLKARACVHICSAGKNDVLSAEHHDCVAALLGFKDTERFFAPEIMMRILYYKSKSVVDALKKVLSLCGKRYFHFHASFMVRKVADEFFLSRNELIVKDHKLFSDTARIIEAFYLYSTTGKEFSYQVEELLKNAACLITKQGRASLQAIHYFREILKGNRVFETLQKMHETGVLGRFIPEFGRLRHLVILESFHQYTVDEHTLLAIRNIEKLRNTRQAKLMYLADILKKVKPEVLFIAILLHDIGKGVSRRHEEAGYIIIKSILERLTVDTHDRQSIEFLVANHIMLSKLAMTRDIDAPETVAQLAEAVGNDENLDALYLMTYADMSAVNSTFWTEWKASILHELYSKTCSHLRGIGHNPHLLLDNRLMKFTEEMSERYLISNTIDEIKSDYSLVEIAKTESLAVSIAERNDTAAEFTVVTYKLTRLFSRIVGVLSSRGLNIVRARLFTGSRGTVVRKIIVSNWKKLYWNGMEKSIIEDLKKAIILDEPIVLHPPQSPEVKGTAKRFEFFLEIENETSDRYTLLEVMVPDKLGLLYDITIRLHVNNIDILSAVINTDDGTAHDVFYLQKNGDKLGLEDCMQVLNGLRAVETVTA